MNCEVAQSALAASQDGELSADEVVSIRAHVAHCVACQQVEQELARADAALRVIATGEPARADAIADRVLATPIAPAPTAVHAPSRMRSAITHLITATLGFLIAALWFEPSSPGTAPVPPVVLSSSDVIAAQFVHATGDITLQSPESNDWTRVQAGTAPMRGCQPDSRVRTPPGAICEIKTATGGIIRLNESSEIKFVSDDQLELVSGQLWCRAADDWPLKIVASTGTSMNDANAPLSFVCPSDTESLVRCLPSEPPQVATSEGAIEICVQDDCQTVPSRSQCVVQNGQVQVWTAAEDQFGTTRWMQPLVTLSGHENPELIRTVDSLLAQVGRTKVSTFYENQLRMLGEYASVPLLKYVVSDLSRDEVPRRHAAIAIAADTAPVWAIPDLLQLIDDDDSVVRDTAAKGLSRLTGESPQLTTAQWKQWWAANEKSIPPRPNAV